MSSSMNPQELEELSDDVCIVAKSAYFQPKRCQMASEPFAILALSKKLSVL